jgi:hypothetical protein
MHPLILAIIPSGDVKGDSLSLGQSKNGRPRLRYTRDVHLESGSVSCSSRMLLISRFRTRSGGSVVSVLLSGKGVTGNILVPISHR